jgi:hypothetical protein
MDTFPSTPEPSPLMGSIAMAHPCSYLFLPQKPEDFKLSPDAPEFVPDCEKRKVSLFETFEENRIKSENVKVLIGMRRFGQYDLHIDLASLISSEWETWPEECLLLSPSEAFFFRVTLCSIGEGTTLAASPAVRLTFFASKPPPCSFRVLVNHSLTGEWAAGQTEMCGELPLLGEKLTIQLRRIPLRA